jgi:hypothetical protein
MENRNPSTIQHTSFKRPERADMFTLLSLVTLKLACNTLQLLGGRPYPYNAGAWTAQLAGAALCVALCVQAAAARGKATVTVLLCVDEDA